MNEVKTIAEKIQKMEIRGAGPIARAVAEGMRIQAETSVVKDSQEFVKELKKAAKILATARPTAVSAPNAVRFLFKRLNAAKEGTELGQLKEHFIQSCKEFITFSEEATQKIGEIGANRLRDGDMIMTHCHSSNVLSVLKTAHNQGKKFEVYCTETRPRLQGLLTAKQLRDAGISTTVIVDCAARYFMEDFDHVIFGADAIAANGAVVNKIGTSEIALVAHEARVRTMVAAETYKFHPGTMAGELVEIEERSPKEVIPNLEEYKGITIRNPAFDITPSEYIDVIVTEMGIIPPQAAILILTEQYGWKISEKEPWE
ncbi:MAG: translation initiation factor IF-2B subunit delta [Theionarchaea archaeon DG-70-1]|nr:MAG: translation initiation factor IF-2B subunit delta [Theionarchaea archaeon DG-70-1]